MKSVRVRQDYTVELPEEVRNQIRPGDALEVVVTRGNVTYVRPNQPDRQKLRELLDRVRKRPCENPPTEEEIEEIIHEVRRERRDRK